MSALRKVARTTPLGERGRTFSADGGTDPAQERWTAGPPAYRRFETTLRIGAGEQCWVRMRVLAQRRYRQRYLNTMRRLGRDVGPVLSGGAA